MLIFLGSAVASRSRYGGCSGMFLALAGAVAISIIATAIVTRGRTV